MTDRRDPVPLAVAGVIIAAMAILVPFTVENTYATFWALVPPVEISDVVRRLFQIAGDVAGHEDGVLFISDEGEELL